jgi:hypothetical protein
VKTLNLLRPAPQRVKWHACESCGKRTAAPAEPCAKHGSHRVCGRCRETLPALYVLQDALAEADARATMAALMSAPPAGLPS